MSQYSLALSVALIASVLLAWINGAVGIIGAEGGANVYYAAVLAIAVGGAAVARLRAQGMARAMAAAATAQVLVPLVAWATGAAPARQVWQADVLGLTVFFAALWLGAAVLFRRASAAR